MKVPFKQVASFILSSIAPFKFGVSIMFLVTFTWSIDLSVRPYILKTIIDKISNPSNQHILDSIYFLGIIYFLLCFILSTVFRIYDYVVTIKMIPNLRKNIATLSFQSLLKQSYSYYQNNFAGSLTNKMNNLISSVPEILQIIYR